MKLHQLIAIERGEREKAKGTGTAAYNAIQSLAGLTGLARHYVPKDDEAGDKLPDETHRVQTTVEMEISRLRDAWIPYWDLAATKDTTNTVAQADVVVDGVTVLAEMPVPTLLWLEKQLVDMRTFMSHLPQLDPTKEWDFDPNTNVYRSKAEETIRSKKVPKFQVLYEATQQHAAQIREYTDDIPVGTWQTTHFSGALPAAKIAQLQNRLSDLLKAVQIAREEANSANVVDKKIGESVFDFLLG